MDCAPAHADSPLMKWVWITLAVVVLVWWVRLLGRVFGWNSRMGPWDGGGMGSI